MSDTPTAVSPIDPSHDLRVMETNPLDYIFHPKSVAVIGATEKEVSVGRTVLWNLISNPFGGFVYPVNPKRPQVLGVHAYPTVGAIPASVDLAVICTAARYVPSLVKECVEAGVKGIIVISAGFKEMGQDGEKLEAEIRSYIRGTNVRLVGPNCLGVMNPLSGVNATFGKGMAYPGRVAFISQSGALCTAILDWSITEHVGFSSFVSIGSMLDVNWGDLIDYFGQDSRTDAIVIYMESVGDARAFLSAAREVALTKPIIVIKAGRTAAAAKAAASHTGSLTGSDDVLDAAFKRVGVMRVDKISDLFAMAETLARQPLPKGPRLTIITNAGGPGVLATDTLVLGGGKLTDISEETFDALNALLPAHWSHNNPIDILGDAEPEKYAKTLEIAAEDSQSHGLLVILTPQDMTNPTLTAEALKPYATKLGKPVLASWMGGAVVSAGREILNHAHIPNFEHPDDACRAFNYLWQYSANLKDIYETPMTGESPDDLMASRAKAQEIIEAVKKDGRTLLNEYESKKLLEAYGIPTVQTEVATNADQAVEWGEKIGYPLVLKLYSNTITHKTDVGGVVLNLNSADAVRQAFERIKNAVAEKHSLADFQGVTVQPMIKLEGYEIILGSSVDPQFGPVLLFGAGGQLVEVFKDRALGLPPLTTTLARRMMQGTKIYTALKGVRGRKSVDMAALEMLMVRFSFLVSQEPWIKELDINPLLASSEALVALDARVLLHDPETKISELPKPAIKPYPLHGITKIKAKTGEELSVRPILAGDEAMVVDFQHGLSEQTVLNRYHQPVILDERTAHARMVRICYTDYDRELSLIATRLNPEKESNGRKGEEIVAICRIARHRQNPRGGEFSLMVADAWQNKGLGRQLLEHAIKVTSQEGLNRFSADVLCSNAGGIALCKSLGFEAKPTDDPSKLRMELVI
ncbi:MAG: bifunctional acetate--CoA ligase family protein/GNAT family N-acetyltransferase [Deltaproteobacteria bacterium]|nr:bifunctional acetate--CoA ligase family protein/GNAT family N-acetyltransferase [Deltaproteobacteria bacterium]